MSLDNYVVTTAATMLPVKLCDVKDWCRVTHSDDDILLMSLTKAASQKAELITNRTLINTTFTAEISNLDCSDQEKGYYLELRRAPFASLTSLEVLVSDSFVAIASSEYNLKPSAHYARIVFESVTDSPDYVPYPYKVVFVAGYGANTENVPEAIQIAIYQMIAYWYQQRGDCDGAAEMPVPARQLLQEYRILNIYG